MSVKNGKNTKQKPRRGKLFQPGNPGRPKGSLNRFTQIKDAFLQAFEDLGGVQALTSWARQPKNRAEFYRLLSKLLPKEVELSFGDFDLSALSDEELQEIAAGKIPGGAKK